MKITSITESGSNNTLLWAISNGADIKSDIPLQSIINDELFFLVRLEDVNMFELFRLTQHFRNKLRIINEHMAAIPDDSDLINRFPGSFTDPENPDVHLPLIDAAKHATSNFLNIVSQMQQDEDIITPGAVRLFIPMIARRYDIQIPVAFMDVIAAFKSVEDTEKVFNENYPNTLNAITETDNNEILNMIYILFMKLTTINRVNPRHDKYIQYIKYTPLKKIGGNKLHKVYMLGFHKFNPITCGINRCTLFNLDPEKVISSLSTISKINSPLEIDVVVQLPIQMMQILENISGPDMLTISYESSMVSILDDGLIFNDFVAPELSPDGSETTEERTNAISAYRARITEANQYMLNVIQIITADKESDVPSAFSLLPSIYLTNAVLTMKVDDIPKLLKKCTDPSLIDMFEDINNTANNIIADMNSSK